jgi:F-type H+-transporting ATPase subunit b
MDRHFLHYSPRPSLESYLQTDYQGPEESGGLHPRFPRRGQKDPGNSGIPLGGILAEGKTMGENIKKEVIQKAHEESNQIVKRAQEEIEFQKEKALMELKERLADLSIMAASKVIEKALDKKDHEQLLDEYISKVGEKYES